MTKPTLEEALKEFPQIKLNLGTDMTNKIDGMASKYMGIGLCIGGALGMLGGIYLGSKYVAPPNVTATVGQAMFMGAWFIGTFGVNVGAALGRLYGSHKVNQLAIDDPERAEDIKKYDAIKTGLTAITVRTPC